MLRTPLSPYALPVTSPLAGWVKCPSCGFAKNRIDVSRVVARTRCSECSAQLEVAPQKPPWKFRDGLVEIDGVTVIGAPVAKSAPPPARPEPQRRPARRRTDPRVALLAFVLLLAVVVGTAVVWARFGRH